MAKKNKIDCSLPEHPSPADYCLVGSAPGSRLSNFERLTLLGGQELDRVVTLVLRQAANFSSAGALQGIDVSALREAASFYGQASWKKDPGLFFEVLPGMPNVLETPVHGLPDGTISDLSFPSRYAARHPQGADRLSNDPHNMVVQARYWRHSVPAKATVVAIHGWTMGDQRVNSIAFLPGVFYRAGFDVVLPELPFHGRRHDPSIKGASGELFPSTDVIRSNEAIGQIMADLQDLAKFLETRSHAPLGCVGMSLGAYVAALWASLPGPGGTSRSNLAFCVPIVPLVSMVEIAWELVTRYSPNLVSAEPDLFEILEDCFAVHCPLHHHLCLDRERVFIIAGIGDSIVPARQPKLLWDHWRRPEIRWLSGGHQTLLEQKAAFAAMFGFIEKLKYG